MYNIEVKDEPADVEDNIYKNDSATFRASSVKPEPTILTPTSTQTYEIKEEAPSIDITFKNIENVAAKCGDILKETEFVNGFVIYELDSFTTTASADSMQSSCKILPTITGPLIKTKSSPPTLLNAKLRKRNSYVSTITATPAVAKQFKCSPIKSMELNENCEQKVTPTHSNMEQSDSMDMKSKCYCHLGKTGLMENELITPAESHELKLFFAKVFNETLQLTRKQQRAIKMETLEAICQAEDDVDAGKLCENCCNNI